MVLRAIEFRSKNFYFMESIDTLGPRPDRLVAFTGDLLSDVEDTELKTIVEEAARDLSTPIALVNLVLEQIQFFRAHYGLPADLVASRGTSRDVSFCQFVVRDGEPFEVNDAEKDERVPQHLVKHYGIRAYLGMPIMANDYVVGSLCVIDTKPRAFSQEDRKNLKQLSKLVNARLAVLAETQKKLKPASKIRSVASALTDLQKSLAPLQEDILLNRINYKAIHAFLQFVDHSLNKRDLHPSILKQTLLVAKEALSTSRDRFFEVEVGFDQTMNLLKSLEQFIQQQSSPPLDLGKILEEAIKPVVPILDYIGGYNIVGTTTQLEITTSRISAVTTLTACLSLLANQMILQSLKSGMSMQVGRENGEVSLLMSGAGLAKNVSQELAKRLSDLLADSPSINIEGVPQGIRVGFSSTHR